MNAKGSELVTPASNYYLAHLTQSAQISESESIPQSCSSHKTPNLSISPLPQLQLGASQQSPLLRLWLQMLWQVNVASEVKCPMMTVFTAGWPLSLIHHSHILRWFAYSLPAAYQHQPFSLRLVLLFLSFPSPAFFPPCVLLQQIPPAKCFTLEI